jgi:hypothetical protein
MKFFCTEKEFRKVKKENHPFGLGRAERPDPTRSASAHLGPAPGPVEPIRPQAAELLRRRRIGLGVHATGNLVPRAYLRRGRVPACRSRRLAICTLPRPAPP